MLTHQKVNLQECISFSSFLGGSAGWKEADSQTRLSLLPVLGPSLGTGQAGCEHDCSWITCVFWVFYSNFESSWFHPSTEQKKNFRNFFQKKFQKKFHSKMLQRMRRVSCPMQCGGPQFVYWDYFLTIAISLLSFLFFLFLSNSNPG